jgi:hypothetical protein
MKNILTLCFILSFAKVFATDYICLNVRYETLNLGEHSFVSIIKGVSEDDYCSGEFGCSTSDNTITTYSLWGSKFSSWKMLKNKKQGSFDLGDELILNRKAVNFVRHCKELVYDTATKDYISQMDNFNTDRKGNLHWGYYYGATQFNCTSFSVEFFNKIANENYSAVSPTLGVETPAMLAIEIMSNMEDNYDSESFFQKLKGTNSKEQVEFDLAVQAYKDRAGPKI